MTARDHLAIYHDHMRVRRLKPGLISRRGALLRAVEHYIDKPLTKATTEDLTRWVLHERQRISDATLYVYVKHLSAFYGWAIDEGLAKRNPVKRLVGPGRPHYLPRPIEESRLQEALEAAEPRARVIVALAAYAGARAIEIARLERTDILDHNDPPVMVLHGKGDRKRVVPIPPRLLEELTLYGLPLRGPVIRRLDGLQGHVSASLVSTAANRHLHALGFTDTLHSGRHRYGTEGLPSERRRPADGAGAARPRVAGHDRLLHRVGEGGSGEGGRAARLDPPSPRLTTSVALVRPK